MLKIVAVVAAFLIVAGCADHTDTPWSKVEAAAVVQKPNTSSPDMAVKSWWSTQDSEIRLDMAVCEQISTVRPSARNLDLLLTEKAKALIGTRTRCNFDRFGRNIDSVDIQSPTLAVVLATIKNDTPPDSGWTGTALDERTKSQGEKYRYRLERPSEQAAWKISKIDVYSRYSGAWESAIESFGPRGHVYVNNWYQ